MKHVSKKPRLENYLIFSQKKTMRNYTFFFFFHLEDADVSAMMHRSWLLGCILTDGEEKWNGTGIAQAHLVLVLSTEPYHNV